MTGRCKTCPHWEPSVGEKDWGWCKLTSCDGDYEHPGALMQTTDTYYGEAIYVSTHASFGCVMHPDNGGERLPDLPAEQVAPTIQ